MPCWNLTGNWSWSGNWWWLTGFWVLGLLAIAGFAVYMSSRSSGRDDAVVVLRRQFAEGKVTEEEYQRKLSLLEKK